MRQSKEARTQLSFGWTRAVQWEDLPEPTRAEIRQVLRPLLQRAIAAGRAEASDEQ
jgi:hypothetical protein